MENDKGKESVLEEGISSSKICEMLTHLSQRIDSLETCASNIEAIAVKLPGVMSATTDAIDEFCSNTARRGVDIDERLRNGLHLLVQLTEPKTMHALSLLLAKIDTLGPLLQTLESLPDTVSVVVDSLTRYAKNAGRIRLILNLL
ncbi:MAG: hypothetical protein MRJ65_17075 [Candidatus Brocadiaceae bacterium]|nr:hypothetical protein [Candidatus Brocadiaceae bacterium]